MTSTLRSALLRLALEEEGQDLVEYALLTALVTIAGVAVFGVIRNNMIIAYDNWTNPARPGSIQDNWIPSPPVS